MKLSKDMQEQLMRSMLGSSDKNGWQTRAEARSAELFEKVAKAILPKVIYELAIDPKMQKYFSTSSYGRLYSEGQYIGSVEVSWQDRPKYRPVGSSIQLNAIKDKKLRAEVEEFVKDYAAKKELYKQTRLDMAATLKKIGTVAKLKAQWPEAYKHAPKEWLAGGTSSPQLPAVQIASIQANINKLKGE